MAGDWIKMRSDLFKHPKVVRIKSALQADALRTVGGLMSVWCLFDAHSVDGTLEGYTLEVIDEELRWSGFSKAMLDVGWLIETGEGLALPEFDTHNGVSAKRRAQDADRKREDRKIPKTSALDADKLRTREEKRREEKINNTSAVIDDDATPNRAAVVAVPAAAWRPDDEILIGLERDHEIPVEFSNSVFDEWQTFYADKKNQTPATWCSRFKARVHEQWARRPPIALRSVS